MFSVGDRVVHPRHGAGIIEDIEQEKVSGTVISYYIFKLPVGAMTVKIPTTSADQIGMRPLISGEEADAVISGIAALPIAVDINWNRRYRENLEKIKTGDLVIIGGVVKELMYRDWKKGLSTGERKILHAARQIIISEVVMAKNITYADAEKLLNEAAAEGRHHTHKCSEQ